MQRLHVPCRAHALAAATHTCDELHIARSHQFQAVALAEGCSRRECQGAARGRGTFLQKFSSLRTSISETSCGVVTTSAPSTPDARRNCAMLMCSSLVPGGASTTSTSSGPQTTSCAAAAASGSQTVGPTLTLLQLAPGGASTTSTSRVPQTTSCAAAAASGSRLPAIP